MSKRKPVIGCLALQGAVEVHRPHIEGAGADFMPVKTPADFDKVDGFILPGGESTTMIRLINVFHLWDILAGQFARKPVWGICAGTILMSEKAVVNDNLSSRNQGEGQDLTQQSFGLLPITVLRNGYGTQVESTHTEINGYTVSFIRAPVIKEAGAGVKTLASYHGDPVWVQGEGEKSRYVASTFHPELTLEFPSPMHKMFVELVEAHTSA